MLLRARAWSSDHVHVIVGVGRPGDAAAPGSVPTSTGQRRRPARCFPGGSRGHRSDVFGVGWLEIVVLVVGLPLVVWAGVTVLRRR